jgi:hypothetical protein
MANTIGGISATLTCYRAKEVSYFYTRYIYIYICKDLGEPIRIWENNIKIDNQEIRYEDVEWIQLARDNNQV